MNIFFTSQSPTASAKWLCKEHLQKMPLESTQLLSTALYELSEYSPEYLQNEVGIYRPVHVSHPSRLWISESPNNFAWLLTHVKEMFLRLSTMNRFHKSELVVKRIDKFFTEEMQSLKFEKQELTPILFAMGSATDNFLDIKERYGTRVSDTRWRGKSFTMSSLGYQEYIRRKQFLPTTKHDKAANIMRRPTWHDDYGKPQWYFPI